MGPYWRFRLNRFLIRFFSVNCGRQAYPTPWCIQFSLHLLQVLIGLHGSTVGSCVTMERSRQNGLVPITTEDRVNDLKSEWITDYYFKCPKKTRFNFVNVHLTEKAKF